MPIAQRTEIVGAPTVSIGMPVYNGERYIREAVDSALKQTMSDFDLIIADNHSTDTTEAICRKYAERDPRIKYIRHDKNYGLHANFSFVARQATGQFFTWLAYDDALEPGFLERGVRYLVQNPQVGMVATDFSIIDENGRELRIDKLDGVRDSIPWKRRRVPFFEFAFPEIYLCFYGVVKTDLCKAIMAEVKSSVMANGIEFPILARFAAASEIASLPVVLRKYRVHNSGTYLAEVAEIKGMPKWRAIWFFYSNLGRIRLDLFIVLMRSNLPATSKIRILSRHMFFDFQWYLYKIGQTLGIYALAAKLNSLWKLFRANYRQNLPGD
jgi:glycosyltransferase involved in cell wall biosynthesis